jgi:hypothetical protein
MSRSPRTSPDPIPVPDDLRGCHPIPVFERMFAIVVAVPPSGTCRGRLESVMAKNTGEGHRQGEVRDRSQVFNPATKTWTKRDSETGKLMDGKEDGDPFKGVRKEH